MGRKRKGRRRKTTSANDDDGGSYSKSKSSGSSAGPIAEFRKYVENSGKFTPKTTHYQAAELVLNNPHRFSKVTIERAKHVRRASKGKKTKGGRFRKSNREYDAGMYSNYDQGQGYGDQGYGYNANDPLYAEYMDSINPYDEPPRTTCSIM